MCLLPVRATDTATVERPTRSVPSADEAAGPKPQTAQTKEPGRSEVAAGALTPTSEQGQSPNGQARPSLGSRLAGWIDPVLPWVVFAWLGGALLLALWHVAVWCRVRRLSRMGIRPAPAGVRRLLEGLVGRLKVRRAVGLLDSAVVEVPTVIGWLRPVILLPAGILGEMSPQQLETILAHELAHIRRHDYLLNLLQIAVETLLFYHPAVWWVSRRIRRAREECCDDLAAAACGDRVLYARALVKLVELRRPEMAEAGSRAMVAADGGALLSRVRRILMQSEDDSGRESTWLGGSLLALIVLIGFVAAAARAYERAEPQHIQRATIPPRPEEQPRRETTPAPKPKSPQQEVPMPAANRQQQIAAPRQDTVYTFFGLDRDPVVAVSVAEPSYGKAGARVLMRTADPARIVQVAACLRGLPSQGGTYQGGSPKATQRRIVLQTDSGQTHELLISGNRLRAPRQTKGGGPFYSDKSALAVEQRLLGLLFAQPLPAQQNPPGQQAGTRSPR